MSTSNHRRRLNLALAGGIAVLAWMWLAHVPGVTLGLAHLGPAVLAFLLLRLGHYPGETTLLVAFVRSAPRRSASSPVALRRRARTRMPRGGSLLAFALAGRSPPFGIRPY